MTNDISKDPVCGMTVQPGRELIVSYDGQALSFCSEFCRATFLEQPERYRTALVTSSYDEAKEHRRVAYSLLLYDFRKIPTFTARMS